MTGKFTANTLSELAKAGDYIETHCANTSALNAITAEGMNMTITEIQ